MRTHTCCRQLLKVRNSSSAESSVSPQAKVCRVHAPCCTTSIRRGSKEFWQPRDVFTFLLLLSKSISRRVLQYVQDQGRLHLTFNCMHSRASSGASDVSFINEPTLWAGSFRLTLGVDSHIWRAVCWILIHLMTSQCLTLCRSACYYVCIRNGPVSFSNSTSIKKKVNKRQNLLL